MGQNATPGHRDVATSKGGTSCRPKATSRDRGAGRPGRCSRRHGGDPRL